MAERLGRYQIREKLGEGPSGDVYAAHDPTLQRMVALRVLAEKPTRPLAPLVHPNVVALYELAEIDGRSVLTMELVEGETLSAWQAAAPRSRRELRAMYRAVGAGLDAIHRAGLVHGRFHTGNVLVGPDGRPRLADLGLPHGGSVEEDRAAYRRAAREALPRRWTPLLLLAALAVAAAIFLVPRDLPLPALPAVAAESTELDRLLTQASALVDAGELARGSAAIEELLALAPREKDDRRIALTWLRVLELQNVGLLRPDRALLLVPAAETAVLRAGNPADLRVALLSETAAVLTESNRPAEALARLGEARLLLAAAGDRGTALADVMARTGRALLRERRLPDALAALEDARGRYPPDHPRLVEVHLDLSEAERLRGQPETAFAQARAALALRERHQPGTAALVDTLSVVGGALHELDRDDEALVMNRRALELGREILPAGSVRLALVIGRYANVLGALHRIDEAILLFEEAVGIHERSGTATKPMAITIMNLGHSFAERGRCAEALPRYQRAAQIFDEVLGPSSLYLIHIAKGLAECSLELGRGGVEALPQLEAAVAIATPGYFKALQEYDRFLLGQILVESGKDPARGLRLVEEARAALATSDAAFVPVALSLIDGWRKTRR